MCLIFAAYRSVPGYRLVIAANRDEFYARPSDAAHFWPDAPGVLAGRDREAGGTWLGMTRDGRFAALTNYRDGGVRRPGAPSRGGLVSGFLREQCDAAEYLTQIAPDAPSYSGFNLLVFDGTALACASNRGPMHPRLEPGRYGLSNHLLDTPWPKVTRGKAALDRVLDAVPPDPDALMAMMFDRAVPQPAALPSTGVDAEHERVLSPMFIQSAAYGTRCVTVLGIPEDGPAWFVERAFDANAEVVDTRRFHAVTSRVSA